MSQPETILPRELTEALQRLARGVKQGDADYALIGGLGVAVRGLVRATRDIDLLVRVPQIRLPGLLESVREQGFQIDLRYAIKTWNEEHLLDFTFGAVRVDWIKAVLPVFHRILDRASWEKAIGTEIRVADAESLLLLKLIAFRSRDQEDIRGILAANPGTLDLDWVRREYGEIANANDPRIDLFERLVEEFYRS